MDIMYADHRTVLGCPCVETQVRRGFQTELDKIRRQTRSAVSRGPLHRREGERVSGGTRRTLLPGTLPTRYHIPKRE
jgi:hypothetical protein